MDEEGGLITDKVARERGMTIPYQGINHYRVALNSNVLLNGGQLKSTFAFQNNIRKEFEESAEEPGLHLDLASYTYDIKYSFPSKGQWEPTIGLQGMYQQNVNKGDEYLIPDYNSNNVGFFGYLKRNFEKGAVNFGLRYDYKKVNGRELYDEDGNMVFTSFQNQFSNVSGSIGLSYEFTKDLIFRANAGSGFRAPNIAEMGANGRHEGTFRYEIGNPDLKQETSLQFDLGLTYTSANITMGINAYSNRIYNYIYAGNFNGETLPFTDEEGLSTTLPVYRFVQTNADLLGAEASVDFHLVKAIHFENTFSYVKGTNRASHSPLPFIPAASLSNELRFEPEIKGIHDGFIRFGLNHAFKQGRFDTFETRTDGYTLIEAGIGGAFKVKQGKINVWLSGQNLSNKLYFNHLSRYKPVGIYNPGRNISFGVNIPI
ncbi:Vitamin B12 transporter BtuB [compost metagenome]